MTQSGISASSFLGLKAELQAARQRAAGTSTQNVVPKKRIGDVLGTRAQRGGRAQDSDEPQVSDLERSRVSLERKASTYERYARGYCTPCTNDAAGGLVDWAMRDYDREPETVEDEDELVDILDEFGRARTVRKVEVPSSDEEDNAIYGPSTQFPVYTRTDARIERSPSPPVHFDADAEPRARGAAFFKFSRDEQERQIQQEQLRALHDETRANRSTSGILPDAPPRSAVRRATRQALIDRRRAEIF